MFYELLLQGPMNYSKKTILLKYKELKERLRRTPTSIEFYHETGLRRTSLNKIFGNNPYSKLQEKCGDAPYREYFKTSMAVKNNFVNINRVDRSNKN